MKTKSKNLKLFDRNAFFIGAFLGGVLAPTYFFYNNFKNLGMKRQARYSIIVGSLAFICVLVLAFSVDDNFPRPLVPGATIFITILLFEIFQAPLFKKQPPKDSQYHTKRALVISLLSLIITLAVIFGIAFAQSQIIVSRYNSKIATLNANDEKAVGIMSRSPDSPKYYLIDGYDSALRYYQQNLIIINELSTPQYFEEVLNAADELPRIKEYTELRIKLLELVKKAVEEESNAYDAEIDKVINDMQPFLSPN